MKNKGKVIALAIALVVVMSAFVVIATENPVSGDKGAKDKDPTPNGETPVVPTPTTITATATAVGYWENITSYEWTLEKVVGGELAQENGEIPAIQIEPGENAVVHFDITANKSAPNIVQTDGARGVVTVTNTGSNPTDNLKISIVIQGLVGGVWTDLAVANVNTEGAPILAAGEEYAYAYDVAFDGSGIAEFRALASVTITNFVDHVDEVYGVEACAEFTLPNDLVYVVLNDEAYLTDLFVVPEGFTYTASLYDGPWILGATGPYPFCVEYTVYNVDAPRDTIYILNNQAKLSLNDTCETILANAQIKVYSGDLETGMDILTAANIVSWTETAEFELNVSPQNFVDLDGESPLEGVEPANVTSVQKIDANTFVVEGTITLTSTGWYATEDMSITYSVMAWVGEQWICLGSIDVNVTEHPVLEACETYSYPFSICISVDAFNQLGLGGVGTLHSVTLAGFVSVDISNLDDDAEELVEISPLFVPAKQDVLTVVTKGSFSDELSFDLPLAGQNAAVRFVNEVCFEQTVVITNCGDTTTVSSYTVIRAETLVEYTCCCKTVSGSVYNNYEHSGFSVINNGHLLTLIESDVSWDSETLNVCARCYETPLDVQSYLAYKGVFTIYNDEGSQAIGNSIALAYGVTASMELPTFPGEEPVLTAA